MGKQGGGKSSAERYEAACNDWRTNAGGSLDRAVPEVCRTVGRRTDVLCQVMTANTLLRIWRRQTRREASVVSSSRSSAHKFASFISPFLPSLAHTAHPGGHPPFFLPHVSLLRSPDSCSRETTTAAAAAKNERKERCVLLEWMRCEG